MFHLKGTFTAGKVDLRISALHRPRTSPAMDLSNRVINPRSCDYPFHSPPSNLSVALRKGYRAQHRQHQIDFLHANFSFRTYFLNAGASNTHRPQYEHKLQG